MAFGNNAPGSTLCEVVQLLVCYDTWIFYSKSIPELSSMERVYVVVHRRLSRRLDRCDRMIQNEGNDSRKLFTLKIALCR